MLHIFSVRESLSFAIPQQIGYNASMQQNLQMVGVYGLILNQHNELLIVQRAPHDTHPGIWEMPGGGLEYGEDVKDGVIREVKEEAGLDVTVLYPIGAVSGFSSKKTHIIRIAYLCKVTEANQNVVLSDEHSDYRWMSLTEKPRENFSNFLKELLRGLTQHPHLLENE